MKKIAKILLMFVLTVSCFASVVAFAGCKEKTIENIGLSNEIKTEYQLNEKLDLLGAKLVLTFSDNTQNEIIITTNMVSGFDTTTVGLKTLKITYRTKEITVDYVVKEDFNTIMSKAAQNLLNADKFEAKMQRYNAVIGWYDYDGYIKNNNCFKVIDLESENSYYLYNLDNLVNIKSYDSSNSTVRIEEGRDIYQIYSYALGLIYSSNESTTFTEISTKIENGKYVVNYNFKQGEDQAMLVTATFSSDCKVEHILIANVCQITYSYTNVPSLSWADFQ